MKTWRAWPAKSTLSVIFCPPCRNDSDCVPQLLQIEWSSNGPKLDSHCMDFLTSQLFLKIVQPHCNKNGTILAPMVVSHVKTFWATDCQGTCVNVMLAKKIVNYHLDSKTNAKIHGEDWKKKEKKKLLEIAEHHSIDYDKKNIHMYCWCQNLPLTVYDSC